MEQALQLLRLRSFLRMGKVEDAWTLYCKSIRPLGLSMKDYRFMRSALLRYHDGRVVVLDTDHQGKFSIQRQNQNTFPSSKMPKDVLMESMSSSQVIETIEKYRFTGAPRLRSVLDFCIDRISPSTSWIVLKHVATHHQLPSSLFVAYVEKLLSTDHLDFAAAVFYSITRHHSKQLDPTNMRLPSHLPFQHSTYLSLFQFHLDHADLPLALSMYTHMRFSGFQIPFSTYSSLISLRLSIDNPIGAMKIVRDMTADDVWSSLYVSESADLFYSVIQKLIPYSPVHAMNLFTTFQETRNRKKWETNWSRHLDLMHSFMDGHVLEGALMVYHDYEVIGTMDDRQSTRIHQIYNRLLTEVYKTGRVYLAHQIRKDMERHQVAVDWRTRVLLRSH